MYSWERIIEYYFVPIESGTCIPNILLCSHFNILMAIIAVDKVVVGIGLLLGSNKALDKVLGEKMIVFGITIRGNSKQY